MNHTLACLLGFSPDLAREEIRALTGKDVVATSNQVVVLPDCSLDPEWLQSQLGGTIKTVELLTQLEDDSQEEIIRKIAQYLPSSDRTITISVGEWGRDHRPPISQIAIKKSLLAQGYKVKFREGNRQGLPGSVLVHHQQICEFIILFWQTGWWLAQTKAVSNPDFWSTRDREKPFAEHKRGMLPPKVARMLVNMGTGQLQPGDNQLVCDPFCGGGAILMEARSRGFSVVGSDIDPVAIQGSQTNLQWQNDVDPGASVTEFELAIADAANFRPSHPEAVACVVTEPFLGKPKPNLSQIPNIVRGLEKMYWGSLKNWSTWLRNDATVVMILPLFSQTGEQTHFSHLIDKITNIGYSTVSSPLEYSQPGAITKRQIYTFRFTRK